MKTASWVLRERDSGYIIAETWDRSVVERLNKAKYEAIPIMKYLMDLNRDIEGQANAA